MRLTKYKRIEKLLKYPFLTVNTYQHVNVLTHLEEHGYITANPKYVPLCKPTWKNLLEKYEWMRSQMNKRIDNYSGDFPIWAWLEHRGNINVKKRFGENQVKIVAKIPAARCLINDFSVWEAVMNNVYYCEDTKVMDGQWTQTNKKEYNIAAKQGKHIPIEYKFNPTKEQLEKSWETPLFKFNKIKDKKLRDYIYYNACKGRYLQVCIDRIYKDEIKSIKHYD